MNILSFNGYEGTAELDMERGVCRGKILFIEDLVTYEADAPSQLQQAFEDAVTDYIATCNEIGKEPQRTLRGVFNVRVSPEIHRAATLRAVSDGMTLNEVVARAMDCYLNVRSDAPQRILVALEPGDPRVQIVRALSSGETDWSVTRVNH